MIYLCIPSRDEAPTLGVLLWKVRKVMKEFGRDYRILVYDDGSVDGTPELLERYKRVVPLEVVRSDRPAGQGAALQALFEHVVDVAPYPKRDVVVTLQADFTDDPSDMVPMIKAIEGGADLVSGTASPTEEAPRKHRITDWVAHRLLRGVLESAPVADPFCGLRAFRVIVLKKALRSEEFKPLAGLEGPALNLVVLRSLVPFARRLSEMPVSSRHELRQRPSRLRMLPALRSLTRIRRFGWLPTEEEAA